MKRKLIPYSLGDRLFLLSLPLFVFGIYLALTKGDYWWALLFVSGIVSIVMASYVLQDQPPQGSSVNEYSEVIGSIGSLGKQLEQLGSFLERERLRVAATEETVRKLSEEKAKLEPLVSTQRETVDAILAAHADRTVRTAWKERLIGFSLGVAASLIASFAYEYLKR